MKVAEVIEGLAGVTVGATKSCGTHVLRVSPEFSKLLEGFVGVRGISTLGVSVSLIDGEAWVSLNTGRVSGYWVGDWLDWLDDVEGLVKLAGHPMLRA